MQCENSYIMVIELSGAQLVNWLQVDLISILGSEASLRLLWKFTQVVAQREITRMIFFYNFKPKIALHKVQWTPFYIQFEITHC